MRDKYKELNTKVINYIQRCFSKAIAQNKNDVEGVKASLNNIPEYVFGNHQKCGKWCNHKVNPSSYKHKDLPCGSSLTNVSLKKKIQKLLQVYISNAEK